MRTHDSKQDALRREHLRDFERQRNAIALLEMAPAAFGLWVTAALIVGGVIGYLIGIAK